MSPTYINNTNNISSQQKRKEIINFLLFCQYARHIYDICIILNKKRVTILNINIVTPFIVIYFNLIIL
jgi:hypothetical protein